MNNNIQILVVGACGSGKTTIIDIINDALIEKGFKPEVEKIDDEPLDWKENKQAREAALRNRLSIDIIERQINRSGDDCE